MPCKLPAWSVNANQSHCVKKIRVLTRPSDLALAPAKCRQLELNLLSTQIPYLEAAGHGATFWFEPSEED
jgi:hypothetical protein